MTTATLIVPPVVVGKMAGFAAARISVRKVALLNEQLAVVHSVNYAQADQVAGKSFTDLVDFVLGRCRKVQAKKVREFQALAGQLLAKHYGLGLEDTHLCDPEIVRQCLAQGYRPYEVVREHASEADLDRIDLSGYYGVASKQILTVKDEEEAIKALKSA